MTNEQILKELEIILKPYDEKIKEYGFSINLTLNNKDHITINRNSYAWGYQVCPNTTVI